MTSSSTHWMRGRLPEGDRRGTAAWDTSDDYRLLAGPVTRVADVRNWVVLYDGPEPDCPAAADYRLVPGATRRPNRSTVATCSIGPAPSRPPTAAGPIVLDQGPTTEGGYAFWAIDTDGSVLVAVPGRGAHSTVYDCGVPSGACTKLGPLETLHGDPMFIGSTCRTRRPDRGRSGRHRDRGGDAGEHHQHPEQGRRQPAADARPDVPADDRPRASRPIARQSRSATTTKIAPATRLAASTARVLSAFTTRRLEVGAESQDGDHHHAGAGPEVADVHAGEVAKTVVRGDIRCRGRWASGSVRRRRTQAEIVGLEPQPAGGEQDQPRHDGLEDAGGRPSRAQPRPRLRGRGRRAPPP